VTGFTLVELLVVIGIIAVLIAILLPRLSAARGSGRTVKCLSNLRQIGIAAVTYTSQNKNYILPADVNDPTRAGEGFGRVWADTWVTILVAEKYLPYPRGIDPNIPPGIDNVFHCPSGVLEQSSITAIANSLPANRKDGNGAMGYLHQSNGLEPGLNVYCWYGINGTSSSAANDPVPCRRVVVTSGTAKGTTKTNEIRNSSEMAFLFDGILGLNFQSTNANRLNARHSNRRITNIAFFDGHAESFPTKSLPGGDGDANAGGGAGNTFSVANLKKYPRPLWRLDQ